MLHCETLLCCLIWTMTRFTVDRSIFPFSFVQLGILLSHKFSRFFLGTMQLHESPLWLTSVPLRFKYLLKTQLVRIHHNILQRGFTFLSCVHVFFTCCMKIVKTCLLLVDLESNDRALFIRSCVGGLLINDVNIGLPKGMVTALALVRRKCSDL